MSDLHFDPHQFAGRPARPVGPGTGLTFDNYSRMGLRDHKTFRNRRWIPPFANNDLQLRRVIAERLWRNLGGNRNSKYRKSWRCPEDLARDWRKLSKLVDAHYRRVSNRMPRGKVKSRAALICAIAWRSWRLGQSSVEIAQELRLSPWNVRQHIYKLKTCARLLGFDCGERHSTYGRKRKVRR